jgi:peroxiredoxin
MRLLSPLLACCLTLFVMPLWASSGQQRAESAGRSLVGQPAPRAVVRTIDGKVIDLGALYGKKAVYLKFWATWCVPCREQMPHLERTFEQAGPDLAVIAIDVGFDDTLQDVRNYRREMGLHMPIVFDGDGSLGAAFHLRVTPQHVVIGRDGRIRYIGHMADARLDAALLAARRATGKVREKGRQVVPPAVDEGRLGVGDRVPALAVPTLDGATFRLYDAAAKRPTVLVFFSPWCESYLASSRPGLAASCRAVRRQVAALARTPGVRWLGIASGLWAERDDLAHYRDQHHLRIPLALDASGVLFHRFGVMHVPTVLVVGAGGKLVRRSEGADPALAAELHALAPR